MLLEIAVTLVMAKILNYLFEKIKQPGVVGEIIAGIILGPCCIGSLSGSSFNLFGATVFEFNFNLSSPEFKELAFIGVVFLLFITGLESDITGLKKAGRLGFYTAISGLIIPFLFGLVIGSVFKLDIIKSMIIGTIFFATSITISIRILSDMDLISSRIGLTLQTAGIISDIIGLFIFSLIMGQGNPFIYLLKITIFLIFILIVGLFVIKYAIKKGVKRQTTVQVLPVGLIICFLFAAFANDMGLAAIIGAFVAGLIIKKTPQAGMITGHIKTIGQTFFIPIFFVWVGSSFSFSNIFSSGQILIPICFIVIFIILGLSGNFIGGMIGAKISGLSTKESISLGVAMMPIMGMALIIVTTSTERGIFGDPTGLLAQQVKTATLLLIIISCLLTPPILKKSVSNNFSNKNKKANFSKITHPILDGASYILNKIQNNRLIKKPQGETNLLLSTILLQVLLIIILNKTLNPFVIVSIIGIIIGSCFGYMVLRYILGARNVKDSLL